MITGVSSSMAFQSTLSMRRATPELDAFDRDMQFQSTLSMRRATKNAAPEIAALMISIHALHEESDRVGRLPLRRLFDFNPRSP